MTRTVTAPYPILRPYTALFMALRERMSALIERMEQESGRAFAPKDRIIMGEDLVQFDIGQIIARVDWNQAHFALSWASDDDIPVRDARAQEYHLDLSELKHAALETSCPRPFFDSYAAFIVFIAQDYLGEFFRDGPTDDIPFSRQLLYVQGLEGVEDPAWIKTFVFTFDDQHRS